MRHTTYRLLRCRAKCSQPVQSQHPRSRPLSTTSRSSSSSLLTLAIETSCDDTCVAILEKDKSGPAARLLFNKKITADNRAYNGIHPIVAAEGHASSLAGLIREALQSLPECGASPDGGSGGLPIRDAKETGTTTDTTTTRRGRRIPDFISVTRGPGMKSALSIGLCTAKGLAVAWQVPLLAVHHMQAHALTPRLVHALEQPWPSSPPLTFPAATAGEATATVTPSFPFLTLLVSGGHTQLLLSSSLTEHATLAEADNIAIGDMLDKCARVILPAEFAGNKDVNYGAALERFAFTSPDTDAGVPLPEPPTYDEYEPPVKRADEVALFIHNHHHHQHSPKPPPNSDPDADDAQSSSSWFLTPPLSESRAMRFDFGGLSGQVQKLITQQRPGMGLAERRVVAYATMKLAFEHLASRVVFALDELRRRRRNPHHHPTTNEKEEVRTLVVSGGVASNQFLRCVLRRVLDVRGYAGVEIVAPPVSLCTDNAAMIAWTGMEMYEAGWESEMDVLPVRRWSMDSSKKAAAADEEGEGGIFSVGGWKRRKVLRE